MRSGGQLVVDALLANRVERVFCVPGESYLPVLDALYDHGGDIQLVVCRQEGGAAFMAEAHGKLTGRPGICMVTRGPGATNASIGVHTAFQDSTPMILLIGQVSTADADREAFQEIDYRRMYGQMAKWVAQIDRTERIPEYLSRAFHTATSGRPGPVVLALPEDVLSASVSAPAPRAVKSLPIGVSDAAMQGFRAMLGRAERPLLILGGGGWTARTSTDMMRFAAANGLPATCAFRRQDSFDNSHDNYAGDVGIAIRPGLARHIEQSDLLVVVGPLLGEMTTGGYSLIEAPYPRQRLVHVLPGVEELNRVYAADLAIGASVSSFAAAAAALEPFDRPDWRERTGAMRAEYLAHVEPPGNPGELQMGEIVRFLRDRLPDDAIVTNGAGNYAGWVHRFYRYRRHGTQAAPTSGAMGYGVPAAVAAKLAHPGRIVVGFSGDGCFQMNGQEIGTAVQYGANAVFIVVNNGIYGTIRMHQERRYPGRVIGTAIRNPDFAMLARAYGAHGELVTRHEDFPAAFERALAAGTPALLELRLDPEAISPGRTLADISGAETVDEGIAFTGN